MSVRDCRSIKTQISCNMDNPISTAVCTFNALAVRLSTELLLLRRSDGHQTALDEWMHAAGEGLWLVLRL